MHVRFPGLLAIVCILSPAFAAPPAPAVFTTSPQMIWQPGKAPSTAPADAEVIDLETATPRQAISGFGGCFNEMGWQALNLLSPEERQTVLEQLFAPNIGCGFELGRMPLGANDYSVDWYSYDETPDDYDLRDFSIAHDRATLIPYLRAALRLNPKLRIWASPWSPPSWMKANRHYAGQATPTNGLSPEHEAHEMTTQFRMEPRVLATYARYIDKFLRAYADEGIPIYAVHVQNEPNSAQVFPSCVWRPEDLATFIGSYLGPLFQLDGRKTEIWLGTIERPQVARVTTILNRPAGRYIHGVGFQWAGKDAIGAVHQLYPRLPLMQTESECGDGKNDWAAAEYTWGLVRHYLSHGASAYMYWNLVLDETGLSHWGWRQNALISIDRTTRQARYNPEFYVMQHVSRFVRPGARFLELEDARIDAIAFQNPNGSRVAIIANLTDAARTASLRSRGALTGVTLPAHSFTTVVLNEQ